ncbi:cytochrome P450 [Sphingobium tyrosinilyticum]|uniref:Cytochrome P450 n=1 Tax=Sphingobium tyrosinilyticum TaxID=2715436 RepID=A0ABV9F1E7_9SPHN
MQVSQEIADIIVDPAAYAQEKPVDDAFTWLRANAPFAQMQPEGYMPIWVATRQEEIQNVELRTDIFSAAQRLPILTTEAVFREREKSGFTGARTLVSMDDPDHVEFRRLTRSWFLPKNLNNLEPRIREIARASVNRMFELGGECDFSRDIALMYPLRVIMEILGVPQEDEAMMLKLTQEFFGTRDPELNRAGGDAANDSVKAQQALQATMAQMTDYFVALIENRRGTPTSDLASVVANGRIHGEPISVGDALGYYIITATAGHDTTSSTTSVGMWTLAERPDLLKTLREDPSLIRPFIDEEVRWASPVKHFMRTAMHDVEIAGQQVRKGDWVMLSYPSGNRDERVFDRPFEFDVTRKPNRHISFGYGPHVCLGQALGMMEMRIFWEELIPRLQSVELSGTPTRMLSNFVCGPKAVPIRYEMN